MPEENNDQKMAEVEVLKTELEQTKEELSNTKSELEKLSEKDYNFSELREKVQKITESVKEKEDALSEKEKSLNEKETNMMQREIDGYMTEALNVLIGEDEETRKKVLAEYNNFANKPVTKDEINEQMRKASLIVNGSKQPTADPIARAAAISGTGYNINKSNTEKLNSDALDLAKKFGITEEQLKKRNLI